MSASGKGVVIDGYKETRQRIKKLNPEADKQFAKTMRYLADQIAGRAKEIAAVEGLQSKGKRPADQHSTLIKGIKRGSVTLEAAEIKSTAYRGYVAPSIRGPYNRQRNAKGALRRTYVGGDFPYPMVYEYGDRVGNTRAGGKYGKRAFLNPAVKASRALIERTFYEAIEKAATQAGWK